MTAATASTEASNSVRIGGSASTTTEASASASAAPTMAAIVWRCVIAIARRSPGGADIAEPSYIGAHERVSVVDDVADPGDDGVELVRDVNLGVAGAGDADGGALGGQFGELEFADAAERGVEDTDPAARLDHAGSVVAELEIVGVDVDERDLAGAVGVEAAQARQRDRRLQRGAEVSVALDRERFAGHGRGDVVEQALAAAERERASGSLPDGDVDSPRNGDALERGNTALLRPRRAGVLVELATRNKERGSERGGCAERAGHALTSVGFSAIRGSHRASQVGIHQARSPSSRITAGTIRQRTRKASSRIATARPRPNCCSIRSGLSRKAAPKTTIMIAPAAVITLPVVTSPSRTAAGASRPYSHCSCMRETRNTS